MISPIVLRRDNSETQSTWFLSGSQNGYAVVTSSSRHPFFSFFSFLVPLSSLSPLISEITFQINYLQPSPCFQPCFWRNLKKNRHHIPFHSTTLTPRKEALQTKSWIWNCLAYHVIPELDYCLCFLSPGSHPSSPSVCWSSQAYLWLFSPLLLIPHPRNTCLEGLLWIRFLLAFWGFKIFFLGSPTLLYVGIVPPSSYQLATWNGLFWTGARYLLVLMTPEIFPTPPPRRPKSGVYQTLLNVLDRNRWIRSSHWRERPRVQPKASYIMGYMLFIVNTKQCPLHCLMMELPKGLYLGF